MHFKQSTRCRGTLNRCLVKCDVYFFSLINITTDHEGNQGGRGKLGQFSRLNIHLPCWTVPPNVSRQTVVSIGDRTGIDQTPRNYIQPPLDFPMVVWMNARSPHFHGLWKPARILMELPHLRKFSYKSEAINRFHALSRDTAAQLSYYQVPYEQYSTGNFRIASRPMVRLHAEFFFTLLGGIPMYYFILYVSSFHYHAL